MEIKEQLQIIDFTSQYAEILFVDGTNFKTPFIAVSEENYLKNLPKLAINKDKTITISSGCDVITFRPKAVLKIKTGSICFTNKIKH